MRTKRTWVLGSLLAITFCIQSPAAHAQNADSSNAIDTSGMTAHPGFHTFYWDNSDGKIWLEIREFDKPFLYVNSLATGLGSNPVGLDRGQLDEERVVKFRKVADRVFLIYENLKYRAVSQSAAERRAVRESFASSVLWGGKLEKSTSGAWLTDFSSFLYRDAHGVVRKLASMDQGNYSMDPDRSFVHLPRTRSFPDNTEFEVALTFSSSNPGRLASRTASDGSQLTLRQHHSFIRLPDVGYRPRAFDPRVGCFATSFADYSTPIDKPLEVRWINRHRLKKRDPGNKPSPPVKPIVYYLDPGAPQPVRDALLEGARWWNSAFEGAGFVDAFQVRMLPEDADPMDVRYNVIQWVHRATRGWSYGRSIVDPRTGEILKGHVTLGSLRVRQDHMLLENMLTVSPRSGAGSSCGLSHFGGGSALFALDEGPASTQAALARIRQLSAHEVGHTLGFAHNFAASTYGDRASVMDYPAPRIGISGGTLDLSDAYGVGVGEWDRFCVRYAYSEIAPGNEQSILDEMVSDALKKKMLYISDADARPAGAAHPLANLWDNGSDPIAELAHVMRVRRFAIDRFSESVLADRQPLSQLGIAFVPVFLHHRFQVEAVAKLLGGFEYTYAVPGDGQTPIERVGSERQRRALFALLDTVKPDELVVPERILKLIPPRPVSSVRDDERFDSRTSPIFDPTGTARTAADLTFGNLLQPQRATRLAQSSDPNWGLEQVMDEVVVRTFKRVETAPGATRSVQRVIRQSFVDQLVSLAESTSASADARAIALNRLMQLKGLAVDRAKKSTKLSVDKSHYEAIVDQINRFVDRPAPTDSAPRRIETPPGSPIGR